MFDVSFLPKSTKELKLVHHKCHDTSYLRYLPTYERPDGSRSALLVCCHRLRKSQFGWKGELIILDLLRWSSTIFREVFGPVKSQEKSHQDGPR